MTFLPVSISADAGLLILRVVIGLLFIGHGLQKLAGWFGGYGIDATAGYFASLGLRPARLWAILAGLGETLGGAGLVLGLLTPLAAAAIVAVMLSAIAFQHWPKGLWISNGGYEYNLVLLAAMATIGLMGAGQYSLDAAWRIGLPPVPTFVVGVVLAVIALAIELITAERKAEARPAEAVPQVPAAKAA
jgi:putative oxidoreductase